MKSAVRLALALTFLGQAGGGQARIVDTEISQPHYVFVRDLIGLSPAQVQNRLSGLDNNWPKVMSFELATARGLLSFAVLTDYLQDTASMEIRARGRNRAMGPGMPKVWSECTVRTDDDDAYDTLLMFRDGKLEGVWSKRDATADGASAPAPGQLPLEDGEAFMSRWGRTLVNKDSAMTVRCVKHESVSDRPLASRQAQDGLSASDFQGVALLPFAVELPFMNASRIANKRRGVALYEHLGPGYPLPGGLTSFLSGHAVANVFRGRDQNYVILKIDLGAYEGRNLSNSNDYGLIGVRDGVVRWRALEYSRASPRLPTETSR
jgi:hypothetical protein